MVAARHAGLLSIGEEDSKGNSLTRDTLPLLRALKGINFKGNVEGRDLFNGHSDVAVCDGFVGNVALKSIEGTAQLLSASLRESLRAGKETLRGQWMRPKQPEAVSSN